MPFSSFIMENPPKKWNVFALYSTRKKIHFDSIICVFIIKGEEFHISSGPTCRGSINAILWCKSQNYTCIHMYLSWVWPQKSTLLFDHEEFFFLQSGLMCVVFDSLMKLAIYSETLQVKFHIFFLTWVNCKKYFVFFNYSIVLSNYSLFYDHWRIWRAF